MKFSKSLKWTIISSISLATVVPIIVFGLVSGNISSRILKNVIQDKNILLTKVLVARIEEYLQQPYEDILNLKILFEEKLISDKSINRYLRTMIDSHSMFLKLQIADGNGKVVNVAPYDEEFINIDVSATPYFLATKSSGTVHWSPTFISPQFDLPVVTISVPYKDNVITAYLSLNNLANSIRSLVVGKDSFVAITDQTATYIAHFKHQKVYQRDHDIFYDEFRENYKGGIMTQTVVNEGIEMICHVSFIQQTDWAVSVFQSKDEAMAPVLDLFQVLIIGGITILVLTVYLALRYTGTISSALSKIVRFTTIVAGGNYDAKMEDLVFGEFKSLGYNFKRMAVNIKAREKKLMESEETFRATFHSKAIGATIIDEQGRFNQFNKKWREITGFSTDELIHLSYFDLIKAEYRSNFEEMIQELQTAGKATEPFEVELVKKSGDTIWLELYSSIVKEKGKVSHIMTMAIEVTDRKKADLEIKRLNHQLQSVFDSMPSILVGVNRKGHIIQWNNKATLVTGVKSQEAMGTPLSSILPHLEQFEQKIRESIDSGEVKEEKKIKRSEKEKGQTIYEDITIYPLLDGEAKVAVIRIDDVSDAVRIEQLMVQSEKMMSLGGLAAGMAHEINNPLGVMIQSAQNIMRRTSLGFKPNKTVSKELNVSLEDVHAYLEKREILGFVENIKDAGRRAADIVSNMLRFSRKSNTEMSYCELPRLIDRAVELAGSDWDLKKKFDFRLIEIKREYEDDLPEIPVIGPEIEQVILNLLKNGAQAMSEGRDMELENTEEKPCFTLKCYKSGHSAVIEVVDNGPGMNDQVKTRIFEPFFTTKAVGSGTGLGLSVSYMIVANNHGGSMEVVSEAGEGTAFIIRLPLTRKDIVLNN